MPPIWPFRQKSQTFCTLLSNKSGLFPYLLMVVQAAENRLFYNICFADYLQHAHQQHLSPQTNLYPMYFTCSQTLTDRASEIISQIVHHGSKTHYWFIFGKKNTA
jgi:hypothetical protein